MMAVTTYNEMPERPLIHRGKWWVIGFAVRGAPRQFRYSIEVLQETRRVGWSLRPPFVSISFVERVRHFVGDGQRTWYETPSAWEVGDGVDQLVKVDPSVHVWLAHAVERYAGRSQREKTAT